MAKPEQEVDDTTRMAATLSEYGTATAVFAIFAWMRDFSLHSVMVMVAFVFVAYVATVVFGRLAGIRRQRSLFSKWPSGLLSGIYAFVLAMVGEFGNQYAEHIGIGGAALAGLGLALGVAAWRQRLRERCLYRELLSPS
ncbi:MAG: hypothetical protein OXH09_06315 [Gammaproteobacteria bacterium]|nr:hypothetical protein [Gammaproteobacteria bacterium]